MHTKNFRAPASSNEVEEIVSPKLIFPPANYSFSLDTLPESKLMFVTDRLSTFQTESKDFTILGYEFQISRDLNFYQTIFSHIIEFNFKNVQDTTYITSQIFEKNNQYFWRARTIIQTTSDDKEITIMGQWSEKKYFNIVFVPVDYIKQ